MHPYIQNTFICLLCLFLNCTATAQTRQWTAGDGLPTGEVQQIIPLPNGQLLLNCEGVFCLTNGHGFTQLPLDFNRVYQLHPYAAAYGHVWEGDSLLWLHDYQRLYLFDMRSRSFLYDTEPYIKTRGLKFLLVNDKWPSDVPERLYAAIDSLDKYDRVTCFARDHQDGAWVGTRRGINYFSPIRQKAVTKHDSNLNQWARSMTDSRGRLWSPRREGLFLIDKDSCHTYTSQNVEGLPHDDNYFICELPYPRFLLCGHRNLLGYFNPETHRFAYRKCI